MSEDRRQDLQDKLVRPSMVARCLGVTRATIYNWIEDGRFSKRKDDAGKIAISSLELREAVIAGTEYKVSTLGDLLKRLDQASMTIRRFTKAGRQGDMRLSDSRLAVPPGGLREAVKPEGGSMEP